jgi:NADP-reducing hydrogenase subunit HndB
MSPMKSFADLKRKREELLKKSSMDIQSQGQQKIKVKVAMATCGLASGAKEIFEFFREQLDRRNIDGTVTSTGCMGYCYAEPTVEITLHASEPVVFGHVDLKKADQIIEKYIKTGELVDGIIPVNYETVDLKIKEE